jgi:hypothetical protein
VTRAAPASRPVRRARRGAAAAVLALGIAAGAAPAAAAPGRQMPDRGQDHVPEGTPITYREYPPTSGPHWPRWAEWGVYPAPVREETFVHNLEHGGVVILYRCATPCPDLVRALEATVRALPASKYGHVKVVLSPNDRLRSRIALLAWRRLDELDGFDPERIVRFVRAYQDRGPEDVP